MLMKKVFIDGKEGTTGLRIYERLSDRSDIEVITLSEERRKDPLARAEAINMSDVTFLCLPDAAAVEAVGMCQNDQTVIIDTSTAHRTDPAFAYGFPELSAAHREKIEKGSRIAVPGCHASGFVALIYPLTEAGILPETARLSCHSLTGYSGGGKKMIAQYQAKERDILLSAPRQYGIAQAHKHLPEMQKVTKLSTAPIFCPIVADYYSGMEVTVPLFAEDISSGCSKADILAAYREKYHSEIINYREASDEGGYLSANALSGSDAMHISIFGNDDRILLTARFDNLGKGASGAALQCMNISLGLDEKLGLEL